MGGKQQLPGHGYNDMEEDEEEICNSIASADAQVAHTHHFS
jgi:hypothetical protein